ncbi:MAG: hypothetical protein R2713_21265 [Ilumatobacteraceae bacterium]
MEYASTDAAVQATAGQVRRVGSITGPIVLTMFSSSSGGWTASSTLPFPAVADLGDATAANPHHTWRATVSAATIAKAWPSIGEFTGVTVLTRSGEGDQGGRVLTIRVDGTAGQVTLTGDTFRRAVGLRSNWFAVVGADGAPTESGAGTTTPSDPCEGRVEPAVTASLATAPPARFEPFVPIRLVDTRDGTGTIARPLTGGCTLQITPEVPAGTTAVSVNVVTVDPVAQGYVTVYPCGVPRPFTSAVQSQVGRIASGSAIVPLGAEGSFCLFSNTTTEIVVDLNGSFAPSASARYEPIVTSGATTAGPAGCSASARWSGCRPVGSAAVPPIRPRRRSRSMRSTPWRRDSDGVALRHAATVGEFGERDGGPVRVERGGRGRGGDGRGVPARECTDAPGRRSERVVQAVGDDRLPRDRAVPPGRHPRRSRVRRPSDDTSTGRSRWRARERCPVRAPSGRCRHR